MAENKSRSGSILLPGKVALLIGGVIAYTHTPELTGLWALGSAAAVGVVTGYGSRWGATLGSLAGFLGGGVAGAGAGAVAGGAVGAAVGNADKTVGAAAGSAVGAGTGAVAGGAAAAIGLAIIGSIAGAVAGGVFAYHVAKTDIVKFFQDEAKSKTEHAELLPQQQPNRPVIASATYRGQTMSVLG